MLVDAVLANEALSVFAQLLPITLIVEEPSDRCFEGRAIDDNRSTRHCSMLDRFAYRRCVLADQEDRTAVARDGFCERREVLALALAACDQDDASAGSNRGTQRTAEAVQCP